MKVSIIVTVYNAEKFLAQCLESLQNQTFDRQNYEILIIDDGSTDRSSDIISEYVNNNSNFWSEHQSNKGLFETRKTALGKVRGDFVGWVDADDFVEPNFIEVLYNAAIMEDSELVYCDYSFYPRKIKTKEKWFRLYKGKIDVEFIERNSQPWNKLVKRELLNELQIGELFVSCYDEAYIKCLINAKNPVSIKQKLYNYRVGEGTMSSSYNNIDHYKSFIVSSKKLLLEMSDLTTKRKYWKDYFEYRVCYYTLLTLLVSAKAKNKNEFNAAKKLLLYDLKASENPLYRQIMTNNFGFLRSFVLRKVIPINYYVSSFICRFALK